VLAIVCVVVRSQIGQWQRDVSSLSTADPRFIQSSFQAADLAIVDALRSPISRGAWLILSLLPVTATLVHTLAGLGSLVLLDRTSESGFTSELWPAGWWILTVVVLLITGAASLAASGSLFVALTRLKTFVSRTFAPGCRPSTSRVNAAVSARVEWEVFVSSKGLDRTGEKSRDAQIAEHLYEVLRDRGISVFLSSRSFELMGVSAYKAAIDEALGDATVLVAVGTTTSHLNSDWVKYEWDAFLADILSGLKPGGRIFVYTEGLTPRELPLALRQMQVFQHPADIERLHRFVRAGLAAQTRPKPSSLASVD
jgi:hypothetical protein